jgi:alpha-beta hydrolase superfamily lysophospholipase
MGAVIAAYFGANYPNEVSRLILEVPPLREEDEAVYSKKYIKKKPFSWRKTSGLIS